MLSNDPPASNPGQNQRAIARLAPHLFVSHRSLNTRRTLHYNNPPSPLSMAPVPTTDPQAGDPWDLRNGATSRSPTPLAGPPNTPQGQDDMVTNTQIVTTTLNTLDADAIVSTRRSTSSPYPASTSSRSSDELAWAHERLGNIQHPPISQDVASRELLSQRQQQEMVRLQGELQRNQEEIGRLQRDLAENERLQHESQNDREEVGRLRGVLQQRQTENERLLRDSQSNREEIGRLLVGEERLRNENLRLAERLQRQEEYQRQEGDQFRGTIQQLAAKDQRHYGCYCIVQ